jgi:hypothetical protein
MLAHASLSRIAETLEAAQQAGPPIAVLHLLCHGGAAGSTFGLCLDGEAGPVVVDAGQVRKQLQPFASMVRLVVLSACDSGNPGGLGNHLGSVAQELHRGGVQSVLASRFPLSVAGSIQLTESFYDTLLFGPASVESAFLFARKRLCRGETNLPGEQRRLDWTSVQLYARHDDGDDTRPIVFRPFRGLLAFLPEHDRFFFGRAREVEKLVQALSTLTAAGKPRFLVVAGDSGSGKSSLVLAGAVPRLLEKASGAVQVAKLRPGSDPQAALDDALKSRPKGAATPVLLIIDQFEELFTHGADAALRKTFVNRLWKLASDAESGVSVLLTLRVDFLGRCSEIPLDGTGVRLDHIVYDESYRVFVPHMGSSEMKSAIEEPLGRVGLQLADGLLTRMLSDVGMEPGALPLLQDTLDLLWQRRQGRVLGQTAYDSLGGVTGALKGRADALIDALTEFEQLMARRLLVRLVSMTRGADAALATRQRVALITLRPPKEEDAACSDRVLAKLVEARLLVLSQEGEEQQVEVAHEALIRQWPRLHEWLRADGERLAALAEFADWVKQWREHGTLLVREQLEYAETIVKRCQEDLGSDARQLLEASRTHRHNERRVGRRLLVLAIALVAMVFPALLSPCSSDQGTPGEHLAKLTTITFLFGMLFSFVIIIFSIFAAARKAWRIFATRKRQGAAVSIGKKKRSLPPQL